MRRRTCLLLAAGMIAGCGAPSSPAPSTPPSDVEVDAARATPRGAHHLDVVAPPDPTAEDVPARQADPSQSSDALSTAHSPASTAADAVLQLVEAEELLVLDLNLSLMFDAERSAVVQVRVLFGTGRSHPHEETYLVRLVEDAGSWAVTDLAVAP